MTEEQLKKGKAALEAIEEHKLYISRLQAFKKDWEEGGWVKIETKERQAMAVSREHFGEYVDKLIESSEFQLSILEHNFKWI